MRNRHSRWQQSAATHNRFSVVGRHAEYLHWPGRILDHGHLSNIHRSGRGALLAILDKVANFSAPDARSVLQLPLGLAARI